MKSKQLVQLGFHRTWTGPRDSPFTCWKVFVSGRPEFHSFIVVWGWKGPYRSSAAVASGISTVAKPSVTAGLSPYNRTELAYDEFPNVSHPHHLCAPGGSEARQSLGHRDLLCAVTPEKTGPGKGMAVLPLCPIYSLAHSLLGSKRVIQHNANFVTWVHPFCTHRAVWHPHIVNGAV